MKITKSSLKHFIILKIGILLLFHCNVVAQDDTSTVRPPPVLPVNYKYRSVVPDKVYFSSWLTDARDIAISPYRWNKYQWIAFSGITLVGGFLYTQDANIQKVVQKNQSAFWGGASRYAFEPWGSGLYTVPALGIMYGVGAIFKDDRARYTALKGVEAYLFAFVTDQIVKQIAHRHRPYQNDPPDPYIWDGPFKSISGNSSFASGHSTVAFAVAAVIASSYKKTIWVPILCYSIAGFTAASRVYQNDHWFSDIFIGSALGFAIGRTISNNHMKKLKILPVSHVGTGIMLVYSID